MTGEGLLSDGIAVAIEILEETGPRFRRRDGVELQEDRVSVDAAFDGYKRTGGQPVAVGMIGEDAPLEPHDVAEQFEQPQQIELKIGVLRLTVVASADDLGAAEIQAHNPAIICRLAIEADAARFDKRLEQIGCRVDEFADPLGTRVPMGTGGTIDLNLLKQMFDRHMRVTQCSHLPVAITQVADPAMDRS